jgi:hypothetical protein
MRRAQNRRSQFPQRYCLIDTNRNDPSSKSWRRDRLIRLLLQFGHVITRKRLYSLIERVQISILVYRLPLSPQNRRPHFVQLYGLIQTKLSSLSRKFRRCDRAIIVLLQLGHLMMVIGRCSHSLMRSSIWSYNGISYRISRLAICAIDFPQWLFKKSTTRPQRATSSNDSSPR